LFKCHAEGAPRKVDTKKRIGNRHCRVRQKEELIMFIETVILSTVLYAGEKAYKKIKKKIWWINENVRDNQLTEILSDADDHEFRETDRKLNKSLAVSSGLAVMNIGGYMLSIPLLSILSIPGLLWLTFPFFKNAYKELTKERKIGLGILDATVAMALLLMRYFIPLSLYFVLMCIIRKLLLRIQDTHRKELIHVFSEIPKNVWVEKDGVEIWIPFEQLQEDDILVINAGETVSADGTVISGHGSMDQHILTGESQPAEKYTGEQVFASTMLMSGRLYIKVEKAGAETVAARIGKILDHTADYKASLQTRGEMISEKVVLPLLSLGALTLLFMGPVSATAVLLAPFCYNMRLISPISILNFLHIASDKGILVKDGRALEVLKDIDTVIFDKTGTLTLEQPCVSRIYPCNSYTQDAILIWAASAELKQSHPIAHAIRQEARQCQLDLPASVDDAVYKSGYGLSVRIKGRHIRVGSERFMKGEGIVIPPSIEEVQNHCSEYGYLLIYVSVDEQLGGVIELHTDIRPEANSVVADLQERGLDIFIISGDKEKITQHLAQKTGIKNYFAEVLPQDKAKIVEKLQQSGKKVCFIGDGINDAIALKQSDVSVSLRGAATMATDTAQIILMDQSLGRVPDLFELANAVDSNMKKNLLATVIPGIICISGVYIFHFGVIAGEVVFFTGVGCGILNAMLPMIKYKKIEKKRGIAAV